MNSFENIVITLRAGCYGETFKSPISRSNIVFNICWIMSFIHPISCGLNISLQRKHRVQSARIWELKKPQVVAELELGVNIEFVPPCRHPVSPQVDALGFFFFLSTDQGLFHAICAWLWDMAFKQGTEQAWLLHRCSKEAGSFHFEWTYLRSDGYHSKQTWH